MSDQGKGSEREERIEVDFSAFEKQIDEEIDKLFVPAGGDSPPLQPPLDLKGEEEEAGGPETADADLDLSSMSSVDAVSLDEPDDYEVPTGPSAEEVQPEAAVEPTPSVAPATPPAAPRPPATENQIPALVESFSVAYLSLDWEFSLENVSKLEAALKRLDPFCKDSPDTATLLKVFKVILHSIEKKPDSLPPELNELMRDVHDLLKDLLLSDQPVGPEERSTFKELIGRVRVARDLGLLGGRAAEGPAADEKPVPRLDAEAPEPGPAPLQEIEASGVETLDELRDWITMAGYRLGEALGRLEDGNRRLFQIEEILGRTPALTPLRTRLSGVRSGSEEQMVLLRELGRQWERQARWLDGFEKGQRDLAAMPAAAGLPEAFSVPEGLQADVPFLDDEPEESPPELRKEQVYLYRLCGKQFALPASEVVKVEKITVAKANKLKSRGYATLADFRSIFRGWKSGLRGKWAQMPAGALKSFQFLPLPYGMLRAPGVPSIVGMVILLSDGEKHGMIFAEPSEVELREETVDVSRAEGSFLGSIETGPNASVDVLDVRWVLSKAYEGEG